MIRRVCLPRHGAKRYATCWLLLVALATPAWAQPKTDEPQNTAARPKPEWYGVMDVGERELRFVLELVPNESDEKSYQLRSLDEGNRTFRLDNFELSDKLTFELKATDAKYSGQLDESKTQATGTWTQRGAQFDLAFRKVDAVADDQLVEVWGGTLNALVQKLELRFRIYAGEDGQKTVRMDSVSQKAGGFKGELSIDGNTWTIQVPVLKAEFTGKLSEDGTRLEGQWKQSLVSFPLKLEKLDPQDLPQAAAPRRPQTPRPPLPYESEQVTFENSADGVTLAGTLTLPPDVPRAPAAILISGSGPQDRDETIVDHKPFAVLADHLTRSGIAVLRYDDRGVGGSTGKFETATSEHFSRDAEAAFDFLKQHPRIQSNCIGLIGHSEGGIVAPMVAARREDVAWIVLLAGTGVNGREILLSQGELILRAEGVNGEEQLKVQRAVQEGLFAALSESAADADPKQVAQKASQLVREKLTEEVFKSNGLEAAIEQGIGRISSPWFRYFLTFEPREALSKVRCPVLALNGEKDTQVDPQLNLPAIEKALQEGHNPPFRSVVLPRLNHLFQTSETGAVSEYQDIEETIAPQMLEVLTDWLRQQTSSACE